MTRNSVRSKHIAKGQVKRSDIGKNAVTSPKVKDFSLLASDFAPGQIAAGPRGPEGPRGEAGAPGQNGIPDLVVRQGGSAAGGSNSNFNTTTGTFDSQGGTATVAATCNPGERATGGGYSAPLGSRGYVVTRSEPEPLTGTPTAWRIEVVSTTTSMTPFVTPYVICAVP